jgi:hypothetical protein
MAIETAFALAGLGGFNAHGAGFLQAARDNAYEPDLVTATSGQILVLANYLSGKPDLREGLIDSNQTDNPFAQLQVALSGYPGVFRPAYRETLQRLVKPPAFTDSLIDIFADRLLPAQQYAPARPDAVIEQVVEVFNASSIGVVFNAYDPSSGLGVLYGNDAARLRMDKTSAIPLAPSQQMKDVKYAGQGKRESSVLPITVQAVKAALWLSLYGFEGLPGGQMDGAYHRSCILSELHSFGRVIVARPLANGWLNATPPRSWFDVQDWQCEMWFSVGYKAEVDAMKRINQLIEDKVITDPKFRLVDLREVTPPTPAGYFNYFVEKETVFKAAYVDADALFKSLAKQGNGPPGAG